MEFNVKVILIGATGLVGKSLLEQLLADSSIEHVKVLARRATGISHPRLSQSIVNFDQLPDDNMFEGYDVLFSCLGTTVKIAKTRAAQYNVDFHMQYRVAELACQSGVKNYVLLSSYGADTQSAVFYSRMKGELDTAVKKLKFEKVSIIRPSVLGGSRESLRIGETLLIGVLGFLSLIPWMKKYRPIDGRCVASAMINAARENQGGYHIYELEDVFRLVK
ncbi:NAD(P)H-binding protein [Pseudoalteromonas ardens]|uniref:NAD(P)H-binding protein n=1 Tax=Pseudoalteromonas ardens TaxID=3048490 RepID=UPI0009E4A52D|nr:NAD(P)H-binding protein [Pseudoalteromonas sp. R96]MDK1310234.1 NAD(P)H-binding protein [Pseudoalteromonas sp. R96]